MIAYLEIIMSSITEHFLKFLDNMIQETTSIAIYLQIFGSYCEFLAIFFETFHTLNTVYKVLRENYGLRVKTDIVFEVHRKFIVTFVPSDIFLP